MRPFLVPVVLQSLQAQVAQILRKHGANAHLYLPGVGVVNGFEAGNYLDSAGTTPATVDNPVGLVIDATHELGPELVANGDFDSGTAGWGVSAGNGTIAAVSGELQLTSGTTGIIASTPVATVIGKTYVLIGTGRRGTFTGPIQFGFGTTSFATPTELTFTTTNNVTKHAVYTATATTTYIICRFSLVESEATAYFDNISAREVAGIHASQATTADKPMLRKGAVNYALYSEDWSNAVHAVSVGGTGTASKTPNYGQAPDGSNTACRIQLSLNGGVTASDSCQVSLGAGAGEGLSRTRTIWIKSISGASVNFLFNIGNATTAHMATATTEWTKVSNFISDDANNSGISLRGSLVGSGVANAIDVLVWHPQVNAGSVVSNPPEYVATTTAPASNLQGNYHFVADSTDLLTATYPAGYESATVVNALSTGQETLSAQNIVGAYSIGPSVDTYGRFVFKTAPNGRDLSTIQKFCNRLAGV